MPIAPVPLSADSFKETDERWRPVGIMVLLAYRRRGSALLGRTFICSPRG